jgi:hypothetical protein
VYLYFFLCIVDHFLLSQWPSFYFYVPLSFNIFLCFFLPRPLFLFIRNVLIAPIFIILFVFPSFHHLYRAHSSFLSDSAAILRHIDRLMIHSKQKQAALRHPTLRLMNCFRDCREINHSCPGQEQRQKARVGGYIELVEGEANTGTIIQ